MGSGKTTFSTFLAGYTGFQLINGDLVAKDLMNTLPTIQDSLIRVFGLQVVTDGMVDSTVLGSIVFSDREKLEQLNAIVHPVLLDTLRNMIFSDSGSAVLIDAALLPLWETEIRSWFNAFVWIDAPVEQRCERISRKVGAADLATIRNRIALQEQLFAAPSPDEWIYIANKGKLSDLQDSAARFAGKFLHLKENL